MYIFTIFNIFILVTSRDPACPLKDVTMSPKAAPASDPADVFAASGPPTLAEVCDRVAAEVVGTRRRDTLSAFSTAAKMLDVDLAAVRATPQAVRELLCTRTAAELGLSDHRWRNVRSLIVRAVKAFGSMPRAVTSRVPHSIAWEALLGRVPKEHKHWRHALNRLASFCSALQVVPESVGSATLKAFHDALMAEELLKNPRKKLKHTIACWNMCQRNVHGWPKQRLASPFEQNTYTLPLEAFPKSFAADLKRWEGRLLNPNVMDPDAPNRPLQQVTVDGHRVQLVRFASALVHRRALKVEEVNGLKALVEDLNRLKEGFRFVLDRNEGKTSPHIANMGHILRAVAKHFVRLPGDQLDELTTICKRLRPERAVGMTARNRARLRQFDDPAKVAALLNFPAAEAKRGRRLKNPYRAAKCFERAVAASLLISTGLRMKNLRTIEFRGDLSWIEGTCYLSIPADRVKNGMALDFELSNETASLLREYIDHYRPLLPGSSGIYLFPAGSGGPRGHNTIADGLMEALRKRAGLKMNPHLFRHAIAKIVVERDPGMALAISRHLGHKRIDTTMHAYLGTEGRVVGRRIDRVISAARKNPTLPVEQA